MKLTGLVLAAISAAAVADGNLRGGDPDGLKDLLNNKIQGLNTGNQVSNKERELDATSDLLNKVKGLTGEAAGRDLDEKPTDLTATVNQLLAAPAVVGRGNFGVQGDPHFRMFNGHKYDFHGGCDLVFLDNPSYNNNQGMRIHIRTKIIKWWSYVESVVVQIGQDTLEVKGGIEDKQYWVNGKPGPVKVKDSMVMPFTIGGHKVRFRVRSDTQFQFKIFLEDDQNLILRSVKDFIKVDFQHHTKEGFGASLGLLGSYEDGQMVGRDGKTILPDENKFGLEWQVRDTDPMLFHNAEGVQYPTLCEIPDPMAMEARRLAEQETKVSYEAAARACLHAQPDDLKDCIDDVLNTGDVAMAGAF